MNQTIKMNLIQRKNFNELECEIFADNILAELFKNKSDSIIYVKDTIYDILDQVDQTLNNLTYNKSGLIIRYTNIKIEFANIRLEFMCRFNIITRSIKWKLVNKNIL
jgi:hypothetical protein